MLPSISRLIKQYWRLLALPLALLLLGAGLPYWSPWRDLERRGFDLMTVVAPAPGQTLPITLVAIDDATIEQVGERWPWPRDIHARLIDRLTAMGAVVIVFDVVFSLPDTEARDRSLAQAIDRADNVVLAAERMRRDTSYGMLVSRIDPLPLFVEAGATVGFANVDMDRDLVLRNMPPDREDVFWRAMHRRLAQIAALPDIPGLPAGALLRYLGPTPVFPVVSAGTVLDEKSGLPAAAFDGQMVLVGRVTQGALELGTEVDLFATPWTAQTGVMTPGVEIQASFLENAVRDLFITPAAPRLQWALALVLTLLTTLAVARLGLVAAGGVLLVVFVDLYALAYYLFVAQKTWLPIFAPSVVPLAGFAAKFGQSIVEERRHKQEIKRMFSLYVPDKVVDVLVAHPEKLSLGGESKQLTVIFCDMQGFTSLSESLPPTRLAYVVNLYLDMLSQVIFDHDGTVDKYIGDAIMAFWGAPLDDPDHALHALEAVRDMFATIPKLNALLVADGLPPVNVRIGMHSGEAVVGNLGSRGRFSYTAVGDTINLAARLEPMNKEFHTRFMFSGATLGLATRNASLPWPVRELGEVTVRGKTQAVKVYTFPDVLE